MPVKKNIKRLFGFFFEQTAESFISEINGALFLRKVSGKYILDAANVNYAFGDLDTFFRKAFKQLKIPRAGHKEVLILGHGAGNVAYLLENAASPPQSITGIESDQLVIDIAGRYFPEKLSRTNVICADAYDFVMAEEQSYDLIIIDIFIDDKVPQKFEQSNFLLKAVNLLNKGGLLFYNRLAHTDKHRTESEAFLAYFNKVCRPVKSYYIHSNMVGLYQKP
jgi:spermidine synthase